MSSKYSAVLMGTHPLKMLLSCWTDHEPVTCGAGTAREIGSSARRLAGSQPRAPGHETVCDVWRRLSQGPQGSSPPPETWRMVELGEGGARFKGSLRTPLRSPSGPDPVRLGAGPACRPLGGREGKTLCVPFAHLSHRRSPCAGAQEVSLAL